MGSSVVLEDYSTLIETDPEIVCGATLLFYLYEIADAVDLHHLQELLGPESGKAPLAFKHGAPSYLQFQHPPVVMAASRWIGKAAILFEAGSNSTTTVW